MKKTKLLTPILMAAIPLLIICVFALFASIAMKSSKSSDIDILLNAEDTGAQCRATFVASKSWQDEGGASVGAQYDFALYNDTEQPLTKWRLRLDTPDGARLDSQWNGEYKMVGNSMLISPVEYNGIIQPHESITFGFVMYSRELYAPETLNAKFYLVYNLTDSPLFWIVAFILAVLLVIGLAYCFFWFKYRGLREKQSEYRSVIDQSFISFSKIIDAKDSYTNGHSLRVAAYSKKMARMSGLSADEQERIYYMALLHDIGKIGIPDDILNKPGSLTPEEMDIVRTHVSIGGDILKDFKAIPGIEEGARYHHERYDGGGYLSGLSGEDIPLCARIICVADSFDAMASARCYRPKRTMVYIMNELVNGKGKQFDPELTDKMIDLIHMGFAPMDQSGTPDTPGK